MAVRYVIRERGRAGPLSLVCCDGDVIKPVRWVRACPELSLDVSSPSSLSSPLDLELYYSRTRSATLSQRSVSLVACTQTMPEPLAVSRASARLHHATPRGAARMPPHTPPPHTPPCPDLSATSALAPSLIGSPPSHTSRSRSCKVTVGLVTVDPMDKPRGCHVRSKHGDAVPLARPCRPALQRLGTPWLWHYGAFSGS